MNFFVSSPSDVSYLVRSEYRFFEDEDDIEDVGVEQVEWDAVLMLPPLLLLAILAGVGDMLDGCDDRLMALKKLVIGGSAAACLLLG